MSEDLKNATRADLIRRGYIKPTLPRPPMRRKPVTPFVVEGLKRKQP